MNFWLVEMQGGCLELRSDKVASPLPCLGHLFHCAVPELYPFLINLVSKCFPEFCKAALAN